MPVIDRNDATDVDSHIDRIFQASDTSDIAVALRRMFIEKLDFETASGLVSLEGAPKGVTLPDTAEVVAQADDVRVVFVPLDITGTDRVRKSEAAAAVRLVSEQLAGDVLLIMTNTSRSQLHIIYPSFENAQPILRRMNIERDLPRRTAIVQLANIYWEWQKAGSLHVALERAFDVEAVTDKFFGEYKRLFDNAMDSVKGFDRTEDEQEQKRLFVQTMFNRLMFVYFLSRKGWLTFKGDNKYLDALWDDYPARSEDKNFYNSRLKPLFFAGLNNPRSADLMRDNPAMHVLIGDVPFLNGGLFDENDLDKRSGVIVPDSVIESILKDLFGRFNFTVMESTPFDIEVAVDPEMLGKVFEELVTGRHQSGSYYTPRPIVSFMCREALKGYLEGQDTGAPIDSVRAFVDERDTSGLSMNTVPRIGAALSEVTVIDPACGSGAYLVGMLQELVELQTALYSDRIGHEAQHLYDLKLRIIERNVYGADIDPFAVNIAMLRLWLSLAIEFEGDVPPPLPNLDFKIVCGDSLLGPDPSSENYGTDLFRNKALEISDKLSSLKARFMEASGQEKSVLASEIESLNSELGQAITEAPAPVGAVDWRIAMGEVFNRHGGFDIVVANPPYVRQEGLSTQKTALAKLYPNVYASTADYHVYFYNRSVELLRTGGELAFITSNKYMRAGYGRKIREYLPNALTLRQVVDFGDLPMFTAASYPAIVVGRKEKPKEGSVLQVADLVIPVRHSLSGRGMPTDRHTISRAMDGLTELLARYGVSQYPQVLLRRDGWILEEPKLVALFNRLMNTGMPLKELVNGRIHSGVKTGLNEAFVIDEAKRQELVKADSRSAEIIKPWLRGRDIKRWRAEWAGLYLIAIQNSGDADARNPWGNARAETEARRIFSETYPAAHDHLSRYEDYETTDRQGRKKRVGLRVRDDQGKWWWELRACKYYKEFAQPKLIWPDITRDMRFAWNTSDAFADMTVFFVSDLNQKYLTLLNSVVAQFLLTFLTYSLRGGYLRLKRQYMDQFPVPELEPLSVATEDTAWYSQQEAVDRIAVDAYRLMPDETTLLNNWRSDVELPLSTANIEPDDEQGEI